MDHESSWEERARIVLEAFERLVDRELEREPDEAMGRRSSAPPSGGE